jgi:hypothetical protein
VPPLVIAELYRCRWQVELFFKWIKQHLFSDGFSSYRSLSKDLNLYPLTIGSGERAAEIFPDVHRVIDRLKTWLRGTYTPCVEQASQSLSGRISLSV